VIVSAFAAASVLMAPRHRNRYMGDFKPAGPAKRWVGRCKGCRAPVNLEGTPVYDCRGDAAVLGSDGLVYNTRVLNSHEIALVAHTCGRWVFTRPVVDGGKPDSKRHVCGSRCTSATGPNCDCRCKGVNHGSGL
jgi:hypothetical protein